MSRAALEDRKSPWVSGSEDVEQGSCLGGAGCKWCFRVEWAQCHIWLGDIGPGKTTLKNPGCSNINDPNLVLHVIWNVSETSLYLFFFSSFGSFWVPCSTGAELNIKNTWLRIRDWNQLYSTTGLHSNLSRTQPSQLRVKSVLGAQSPEILLTNVFHPDLGFSYNLLDWCVK